MYPVCKCIMLDPSCSGADEAYGVCQSTALCTPDYWSTPYLGGFGREGGWAIFGAGGAMGR